MAWGMLSRPKGVERETMAAKPELEAFSDALKRAREDSGMSLRALAEAVEASHTVVAQWERGEHAPRPPGSGCWSMCCNSHQGRYRACWGTGLPRPPMHTPLASSRRPGRTRGWASATAGS